VSLVCLLIMCSMPVCVCVCVCVSRVPVHSVQYAVDDADSDDADVLHEVMSSDDIMSLLQQVVACNSHQLNLFTCCHSSTSAAERDVLDKLAAVSVDSDVTDDGSHSQQLDDSLTRRRCAGSDTRRREFVVNCEQFHAPSTMHVSSSHKNLTFIQGQMMLMFLLQL